MSGSDDAPLKVDESDTMQLIRQAVLFENLELVTDLIRENPWSLSRMDRHGRTPLMLAAHNGRVDSLKTLLALSDNNVNASNGAGKTALHLAAEAGEVSAVRHLLVAGADTERRDAAGHCALESAHIAGHDNVAAAIIESIQLENDKLNEAHAQLMVACAEGDVEAADRILANFPAKDHYAILNGRTPESDTALFIACTNGQLNVVKRLLESNYDHVLVNQNTKDTVLHAAVSSQNVDVLQIMLEAFPALIANSNCDGCSCLHWAAESGSTEIVRCLLEFEFPEQYIKEIDLLSCPPYRFAIDVNNGDNECRTALYRAASKGHTNVLQYMLAFRCLFTDGEMRCPFQLDVYCSRGRTPLMVAAYNQSLPVLTLLLDAGADVNLPLAILDSETCEEARCIGSGALVEATRSDAVHIVHFLHDRGALDTDNRALRLAAKNNNNKLIRIFLTRLVYPDSEYKVNKRNIDVGQIQVGQNLLPSSLCPSRAAMLNWSSASLETLQSDWFIAAALQINPRLRTTRLSLAAITRVDLSCNRLTVFPSILFQMPSLRSLNLAENLITTIDMPGFYVTSTSLEILNLKQNRLESISPQFLSSLPQLTVLDVSRNCLTQLPEFIWLCPSLKEINAASNHLASLPMVGSAARLGRVTRGGLNQQPATPISPTKAESISISEALDEPSNVLTKPLIRQNVWQSAINLSKVDDENFFPDFPVTSSSTLTTLNLSANRFQVFPFCLACTCPRLLSLNMSYNQLISLPPIQCIPAHVRNLDFSGNLIKEPFQLPSIVHTVCHAVTPSSDSTTIAVRRPRSPARQNRSRSKSAVRSQRSLSVSRHQPDIHIEEACLHKQHDTLEWLKTLNISTNQLESIPICLKNKVLFPSLSVLDASSNVIKVIGADISRLSSLSVLNLTGNKGIQTLPPELGMLSRLWSLSLKGCQLKEPLDSMVNTDNCKTVEIVAHLKTILEESKTYHHLRLLILGSDGVGKSQLWDGLRSEAVQKKSPSQGESVRIAEWKFEAKKQKNEAAHGPIAFSAWDFTGQREYHATHHYFLTRRTLYVVVWRVTDGDLALHDVQKWLINIQARAPNSCVVLVGTHVDQISSNPTKFPCGFLEEIENKIRSRFMIVDADKHGLPRVLELVLVNGKARNDIKNLLNVIYTSGWEVRIGKERALDQQIPSAYIAMLKVVRELHADLRKEATSAIMTAEQFRERTKQRMISKFGRTFRDDIEFRGVCAFLHDSGEIVHFEDAALRQLIFVDPLWLADYLAAIVALRSPHRAAGLLCQDALVPLIKQFRCVGFGAPLRGSLLDLLQKCELALPCLARLLVVPALLPDEYRLRADYHTACVKVSAKISSWNIRAPAEVVSHPPLARTVVSGWQRSMEHLPLSPKKSVNGAIISEAVFAFSFHQEKQLRRLYAMSYIPAGFWSRLITRIIGDENVMRAVECMFATKVRSDVARLQPICDSQLKAEWIIWQTGIELMIKGHSVFVLKQFYAQAEVRDLDYTLLNFRTRDEQKRWRTFPLDQYALVEMLFPALSVTVTDKTHKMVMSTEGEGSTRLLALVVDLLDTLLEDWYPAIGTRFVHSSEGDLLVNRFVPCSKCASEITTEVQHARDDADLTSKKSTSSVRGSKTTGDISALYVIHCFSIEECMLAGREYGWLECPSHSGVHMRDVAPDTVFVDIESSLVIGTDQIRRGRLLGRGAFGFVFRATVKLQSSELCEVAQKMLEPVDPGPGARPTALAAYKAGADKWRRDSLEFASRAYCTSRQELNLLSRLHHTNIIGLMGVCVSPLSLVVELAPLGALNQLLASHRKSGARLGLSVLRDSAVQVAKALEYLHAAHIIYRDLKSENVLAWRFPSPFAAMTDVLLKLGDYGISRTVMPSGGAKGFGGTEGFMAPEIVRFNGEEEYTQKVDCFSFGMFLYELITLKHPFEGQEHVKERLLEGARPVFLPHELLVPSPMLDLVVHCWATLPDDRPSSSQLVGYCSAPEFTHILDVCELEEALPPSSVLPYYTGDDMDDPDDFEAQLWLGGKNITVMSCTQYGWLDQKVIETAFRARFTNRVRDTVWSCDESGEVTVFATSLHELTRLQLPSLTAPIIRAPELIGSDVLLLVTGRQLVLLRLSDSNSVTLLAALDSPFTIKNAAVVVQGSNRQIWTGHSEGRISIHHLSQEDKFSFSSSLYLPEEKVIVRDIVSSRDGSNVWVTTEGGSRVFCWDVERRQICSSLDIRKVMPGSETIHTLDVELAEDNFVTSIALHECSDGAQLYVGTSKGLLVVANALLLQPLSACRPYGGELTSICVVEGARDEELSFKVRSTLSTTSSESGLGWVRERVSETLERIRGSPAPLAGQGTAAVVTIGRAFRSLSHRFVASSSLNDTYSVAIWRTEEWV
uniref:non-specific serine/threonine protein kinase n=1 Tax=Haemonchus contortus TaxID=6289 RepID=A0A7I4XV63_HAECO